MSKVKAKTLGDLFSAIKPLLSPADILVSKLDAKISAQIIRARLDKHMNQKEFAAYMGVSQSMVSKWESSNYNYSIENLARIMDKLDYTVDISFTKNAVSQFIEAPRYQQTNLKEPGTIFKPELMVKAG